MTACDLVDLEAGSISPRIFADPEIYKREVERVFSGSWLFVAHTSEIPNAGDFVTRSMGEDPVIVCRGGDGQVRVFLNVCRHRGRKLCGDDGGNVQRFTCGYHGWTYSDSGELTGVPFFDAYQGRLEKSACGLRHAAAVDAYKGLIFASWDTPGDSLSDYLGDMKWVLDLLFGRSQAVEVIGPPIRWQAAVNWKLAALNFAGDGQHVLTTHGFSTQFGLHRGRQEGSGPTPGYKVCTDKGHGANLVFSPSGRDEPFFSLPRELWPEFEEQLDKEQVGIMRDLLLLAGNVFPNLSFLETAGHTPQEWGGPDGMPMSFLTLRQWQPKGPGQIEAWTWLLVDRNAPEEWKRYSRSCGLRVFGPAGTFEQDDLENWALVTEASRGPVAQRLRHHYGMRLDAEPSKEWPGPGLAYYGRPSLFDVNERMFFSHWLELLEQE